MPKTTQNAAARMRPAEVVRTAGLAVVFQEGESRAMPASRRLFLTVVSCLSAILACAADCQAQGESPRYEGTNAQVIDFQRLPAAPRRCFAVVGDVERPGAYYTTDRKVSRARILTRAGSLALMGGYFTTYNSGLSNPSDMIFNAETTEAAHRDVIVVTGKKKPGTTLSSADFHVAIIGLTPDPVVVRLPASQRSLGGLMARLKQHPEVAASASVNGVKSTEPLKNGDVILVHSQLVDRSVLAECDAILPSQELDAAPSKSTSAESPVFEQQFAALPVLDAPPISALQPAAASEVVEPSQMAAGAQAAVSPPQAHLIEATAPPELPPVVQLPARIPRQDPTGHQSVQNANYQTAAETVAGPSIRSLVILSALGTLGLGIALIWIASERRLRTATLPGPIPIVAPMIAAEPVRDEFAELVRGRVEIEDEPVVLPAKIALHGQAVGQKRLIVHPPEPLAGPHFGNVGSTERPVTARPVRTAVTTAAPNAPVRSPQDAEGLLDRVLLAMHREGRK